MRLRERSGGFTRIGLVGYALVDWVGWVGAWDSSAQPGVVSVFRRLETFSRIGKQVVTHSYTHLRIIAVCCVLTSLGPNEKS